VSKTISQPGAGFAKGSIEVFGHLVGYVEAGSGDDVLIICPGSAGSEPSWTKDLLSRQMRVIELNPPGWGGVTRLRHRIDQRELSVVLAAAVRELGVDHYYLHGSSMGGVSALWLAAQCPARVRCVSTEGGMNFVREEDLVSPENIRILAEMVSRGDPEGTGYPRAKPHPRKPWADDAYIREQMRRRIPMMQMVTNRHETELSELMRSTPVPILAALGDQDELLRPNHLDTWSEVLPEASTVIVPGAAHDIQNTEPEALVSALQTFWQANPHR
jgi:pimeloyl-ACP methyl ester carboxylesterase